MVSVKQVGLVLALAGAFVLASVGANAQADLTADEMSSPEWRDCAGHFFFLSRMMAKSPDDPVAKRFLGMGYMAIYAAEAKAKTEATSGDTSGGRGKSLNDPQSGQLKVNTAEMIDDHGAKATKMGREPYVQAYAAKCGKPITAFSQRFDAATRK